MSINTPCIGICSTTYGDQVCRGCNRFLHEITHWNSYTNKQKLLVWKRIEEGIVLILSRKLVIENQQSLETALQQQGVRYNKKSPALCWVQSLLHKASQQHIDLKECGIKLHANLQQPNLAELTIQINQELFELAKAIYLRQSQRMPIITAE